MYDLKILEFDTQIDLELPLIIVKKKKPFAKNNKSTSLYTITR
jgi:hypothetical protein